MEVLYCFEWRLRLPAANRYSVKFRTEQSKKNKMETKRVKVLRSKSNFRTKRMHSQAIKWIYQTKMKNEEERKRRSSTADTDSVRFQSIMAFFCCLTIPAGGRHQNGQLTVRSRRWYRTRRRKKHFFHIFRVWPIQHLAMFISITFTPRWMFTHFTNNKTWIHERNTPKGGLVFKTTNVYECIYRQLHKKLGAETRFHWTWNFWSIQPTSASGHPVVTLIVLPRHRKLSPRGRRHLLRFYCRMKMTAN